MGLIIITMKYLLRANKIFISNKKQSGKVNLAGVVFTYFLTIFFFFFLAIIHLLMLLLYSSLIILACCLLEIRAYGVSVNVWMGEQHHTAFLLHLLLLSSLLLLFWYEYH